MQPLTGFHQFLTSFTGFYRVFARFSSFSLLHNKFLLVWTRPNLLFSLILPTTVSSISHQRRNSNDQSHRKQTSLAWRSISTPPRVLTAEPTHTKISKRKTTHSRPLDRRRTTRAPFSLVGFSQTRLRRSSFSRPICCSAGRLTKRFTTPQTPFRVSIVGRLSLPLRT